MNWELEYVNKLGLPLTKQVIAFILRNVFACHK